ncbi:MAG: MoxR family ATPase [Planctomycetota bacterium]|nr:MoxR family ATPase [Planctomycetota bacterium]
MTPEDDQKQAGHSDAQASDRSGLKSVGDTVDRIGRVRQELESELEKIIVGQKEVIEQILICLFSQGHCLLEGVPGLAKTLLISTLSRLLELAFSRIQFTPDLMPADITGSEIIEENRSTGQRERRFLRGPIFSNVLLADEINRTPPKTQAALLEAMQEGQVTIGMQRHALPSPFFVLATQNPIEQEGTYPLPEAQQDRFMMKIFVDYPNFDDEFEIAKRTTVRGSEQVSTVVDGDAIQEFQQWVKDVPVADHLVRYVIALVRQTRVGQDHLPEFVEESVAWGAGPRAVQFLILASKARALLHGRSHVTTADIQALARPVLRHRIAVNFAAESEGIRADDIIEQLIAATPEKEDELIRDERFKKIFSS